MSNRVNLADIQPQPAKASSSLPIAPRLQRLPLEELPWETFEQLCVRLVKQDPDTEFAQTYGVRGQNQEGIDLYVRKRSNGRYVVWQCKRYQEFTKTELSKAVRRFLIAFRTEEAGIPIQDADALVLAVTADLSGTEIAKEIERQNKRLRRFNLSFVPLDIQGLSDRLKAHQDIVEDFFHPSWVEEFCGVKRSRSIPGDLEVVVFQTTLRTAQEGLSSYGNDDLDRIRDLWGERREGEALAKLEQFKSASTWPLLKPEVQAKALRIEAGLRLQENDATSARRLFDESKKIAPNANARILEGRLLQHDKGAEAALAFLNQPKTDDEWVFRWNLLLPLGRAKEVTNEFAAMLRQEIPPGDFSSVLALAQLAQFDVPAADQTIQNALQKKPHHVSSRYVAAVVDYYWGISVAFRAWRHLNWPVPPPWNLVKRDESSRQRRRRAVQVFEELGTTVLKEDAGELNVWRLACVALNSGDDSQASGLVRDYLAKDPADLPVLVWATSLDLQFDRTHSITALKQRIDSGNGSIEEFLALLCLLEGKSHVEFVAKLLGDYRQLFVKAGREYLWYLHQAQSLVERNKTSEALQLAASMPETEESDHIKIVVQHLVAERTRRKEDYQLLATAQARAFLKNNSAENLLDCCRTHRLLKEWDFIAQHAQELVHDIGTQGALEIAAEGLLQVRRPQECLDLLDNNLGLCQGGEWSPFLRQLAAEAHRLLGNLPRAILELKRAAAAEEGIGAKMQLFQTQLQMGDLPGALQIARSFSQTPHVPAEFLLGQVIPVARHHDAELAKDLILKLGGTSSELTPPLQAKLMEEASRAGVESTFRELLGRLTQQAAVGKGPLKAFTYEQTRQMLVDSQKTAEKLWEAYARGEIPAHGLSSRVNLPLAKLLHQLPQFNLRSRQPSLSPPVLTRYAGVADSEPCSLPTDCAELFLDLTSFLLLDALGFLPWVENLFDHLHVGASLVQGLEEHLDELTAPQPGRASARKGIVDAIENSRLALWEPATTPLPADSPLLPLITEKGLNWCQRLSRCHSDLGLFVDFLPLRSKLDINRTVVLPEMFGREVISAQQLIHAMGRAGWISEIERVTAISSLGHKETERVDTIQLREGMGVHLDTGQAEEIALGGVLHPLCEKAQVTIEASEAARFRDEVWKERENLELKNEVQRLLAHVSTGISMGKYQVHVGKQFVFKKGESVLSSTERALFEALDFAGERNVPVCIDDRFIRRHSAIGKAPLCDTWDIIHHLRDRGVITHGVCRDARAKMRAANLRYLPVSSEEILLCLRAAPIQNDELQETPELACLRRYVATTLLDQDTLQGPLRDPEGRTNPREGVWPTRLQVAITKAMADLWLQADPSNNHAQLQADWIWFNLSFELRPPAELFSHKSPDYDPRDAMAHQIGLLFAFGIGLYGSVAPSEIEGGRRKGYFQWLVDRVISPLLPNSPDLWSRSAKRLRVMLTFLPGFRKSPPGDGDEEIKSSLVRRLIATYITDLPPELLGCLDLDSEGLKVLGLISNSPGVETLGLTFPASAFWEAIARTLRTQHAELCSPDGQTTLRLRYDPQAYRILISAEAASNNWTGLNVPFLQLLSDDKKQRRSTLRSEVALFDLDEPRLSKIIREITNTSSAAERVAKRATRLEESAVFLYAQLSQDIREKKSPCIFNLFPNRPDCLRRYLRQELADKTVDDFIRRLIQSVGLVQTIVRSSRLPTPLPDIVIKGWKQLTASEQGAHLNELKSHVASPIERLRFLELLCHPDTIASGRLDEAKAQLNWLTDPKKGLAHGQAMLAVVRWAYLRLGWHAETSKWPAFTRLCVAWSHGCALYRAFQPVSEPVSVQKWFSDNAQELFADHFSSAAGVADSANPIQLRICTLILKGAASLCAGLNDDQIRDLGIQEKLPPIVAENSHADHLGIWEDRALGGNLLKSYLGDLVDQRTQRVVGEVVFNERFRIQPHDVAEYAAGELLKNPRDLEAMALLTSVVGDRPIYENLRVKTQDILAGIDLVQQFKTSPFECQRYVLFAGRLAASSAGMASNQKVWEQCLRLSEHLASTTPTNEKERAIHQQLAFLFTDTAIRLSASSEGRRAGLDAFIRKLTEVVTRWPGFAKHNSPGLIQVLSRVPATEFTRLPELMSLMRARA